jgi:hypothetical protein
MKILLEGIAIFFKIDIMATHMTFYDIIVHNLSCLVSKVLEIAI